MWQSSSGIRTVSVVIAAANESKTIGEVISAVKQLHIIDKIIVVDDASTDNTSDIARSNDCLVIRNEFKLGQTRSLKRGINITTTDLVITMDADLDHLPSDIPRLLQFMDESVADIVIGRRSRLPRNSEKLMSYIVSRRTGVVDTISGFRLISRKALQQVEFDNEDTWGSLFLIRCAKGKLKIREFPITTPPIRAISRTGGKFLSNMRILYALLKDIFCIAGMI